MFTLQKKTLYNCYVDESGCEGFNFDKGSKPWFVLSAVVVRSDLDRDLGNSVSEFKHNFYTTARNTPPVDLHWVNLAPLARMSYIQHIAVKDYKQFVVAMWKEKLDKATFINRPAYLYRYGFKMLVERVSRYVESQNGWMKIIVSDSKAINMNDLRDYIGREQRKDDGIRSVFNPLAIMPSTMKKTVMLRVADACTSAFGNAFNPDRKGIYHPEYADFLIPNLYRSYGRLLKYGLKVFPENGDLLTRFPFLGNWLNTRASPESYSTTVISG